MNMLIRMSWLARQENILTGNGKKETKPGFGMLAENYGGTVVGVAEGRG